MKNLIKVFVLALLTLSFSFALVSCDFDLNLGFLNSFGQGNGENKDSDDTNNESLDGDNGNSDDGNGKEDSSNPGSENKDPTAQTPVSYPTVKVVRDDGKEVSGIIVCMFDAAGKQLEMTSLDKGVAEFKSLPLGSYNFELKFVKDADKYYYDKTLCVFDNTKREVTVTIYSKLGGADYDISGPAFEDTDAKAYQLATGSYAVKVKAGMTYFVFLPEKSGNYGISVSGAQNVKVGNYGIPNYVQSNDISESDGEGFSIEVTPLEGDLSQYTPYVIGIHAQSTTDCILKIEYLGDISDNPTYKPWSDITAKMPLTQFSVEEGKEFSALDITDSTLKVVLDSNGYYHLGTVDGPLVVVKVKEGTDYIVSFEEICKTSTFGWYHFEGDKFIKKERFNELILSYAEICDDSYGVCPLTEELAYAIRMNGEYHDWWNFETENHIFGEDASTVITELAWLFACGIIE